MNKVAKKLYKKENFKFFCNFFKININIPDSFVEKKEIRHILITDSDYKKFLKFEI